jgi:hypothetical protein
MYKNRSHFSQRNNKTYVNKILPRDENGFLLDKSQKTHIKTIDPVVFCGEIKHETAMAYLIFDGLNEVWIPKSQLTAEPCKIGLNGNNFEFVIPEWLAKEKGII